jgi:hypothetical protein
VDVSLARVAQSAERSAVNRKVGGSNPPVSEFLFLPFSLLIPPCTPQYHCLLYSFQILSEGTLIMSVFINYNGANTRKSSHARRITPEQSAIGSNDLDSGWHHQ